MSRPLMTEEQREMAVILLINTLRGRYVRPGPPAIGDTNVVISSAIRSRRDANNRYVQGMLDLLAVLFANGRPGADQCLQIALQRLRQEVERTTPSDPPESTL